MYFVSSRGLHHLEKPRTPIEDYNWTMVVEVLEPRGVSEVELLNITLAWTIRGIVPPNLRAYRVEEFTLDLSRPGPKSPLIVVPAAHMAANSQAYSRYGGSLPMVDPLSSAISCRDGS